jgi:hypothetical protein
MPRKANRVSEKENPMNKAGFQIALTLMSIGVAILVVALAWML